MKKGIIIVLSFFILTVTQVSFLPHFPVMGWVPNLVLIAVGMLAAFLSLRTGITAALIGGFFLDVYSSLPFGFWIILSASLFFAAHYFLQRYVRIPRYI